MATAPQKLVVQDALSAAARAVVLDPDLLESFGADQLLEVGRELRSWQPHLALAAHGLAVSRSIGRRRGGALVSLASTQRRNGKPSDALDSISEALELDDSPSLALRANTCRVGALRDIGELQRAQALGERLEQLYPDDPKVLRALAAVYRDLFGAGDTRADGLFSLASALEELPQDNFGFADLRNVTPELDALLDRAGRIDDPHSGTFCAFDHWREVFRPELEEIAFSQRADPRLRSERAYALIALLVFRRLPPCRACGRLYSER